MSAPDAGGSVQAEAGVTKVTGPFSEGEKVLAYHGPKIYEAKIQRAELRKKEWRYFIHYLGWSKNWDEWLEVSRLLKYTDANISKQEESHGGEKVKGKSKGGKDVKQEKEDVKAPGGRGKKRKHEGKTEGTVEEREDEPEPVMKIAIPPALKRQLVDGWTLINQEEKLLSLPTKINVLEILRLYLEHKSSKEPLGNGSDMTKEVVDGMRTYFDRALPAMLLYKNERDQYSRLFPDNTTFTPSAVYGAEHLLRLFVKLPELLVHTGMEEDAMGHLQQKIADFLKFLQRNQTTFFSNSYILSPGAIPSKGSQK